MLIVFKFVFYSHIQRFGAPSLNVTSGLFVSSSISTKLSSANLKCVTSILSRSCRCTRLKSQVRVRCLVEIEFRSWIQMCHVCRSGFKQFGFLEVCKMASRFTTAAFSFNSWIIPFIQTLSNGFSMSMFSSAAGFCLKLFFYQQVESVK